MAVRPPKPLLLERRNKRRGYFFQQLSNGLIIGSMYALIALGYTMVYGIWQLINFAHGEVFMIGSYVGLAVLSFFISSGLGASLPIALVLLITFLVAMASCALLGLALNVWLIGHCATPHDCLC